MKKRRISGFGRAEYAAPTKRSGPRAPMVMFVRWLRSGPSAVVRSLLAVASDRKASISIVTALAMPALVGGVALGVEVTYWLYTQRSMQNAADAAALAAATNGGTNYATEAKAVTAQYGF